MTLLDYARKALDAAAALVADGRDPAEVITTAQQRLNAMVHDERTPTEADMQELDAVRDATGG